MPPIIASEFGGSHEAPYVNDPPYSGAVYTMPLVGSVTYFLSAAAAAPALSLSPAANETVAASANASAIDTNLETIVVPPLGSPCDDPLVRLLPATPAGVAGG